MLITPRVTRFSVPDIQGEVAIDARTRGRSRGSYILIIHLRNQDIAFVKINLGDLTVNTIGFTRHVTAFAILLSLSRVAST